MFVANRSKKLDAIHFATKYVVIADLIFTTPAIIVQIVSGIILFNIQGYSLSDQWLLHAIYLFIFSGICWLIVVYLQYKMRDMARTSYENNSSLPELYWHYEKIWVALGVVTFPAVIIIFYLMVFRSY